MALVYAATLVVAVSILTLIAYQTHSDTAYKNVLKEIKTAIRFATTPLRAPTTGELEYVGRRLVLEGVVLGGYIVDEGDRIVGEFGKNRPDAENIAGINQSAYRRAANGEHIDLRYSGIPSGLAYDFVVRIDRRQSQDAVLSAVYKKTTAGVVSVATGLALFFAAFYYFALRPLARLRDGIIHAISDIEHVEEHRLDCRRRDEIGEVANAINMLIAAASSSRREETEAFGKFMEASDIPIIKLIDGRTIDYANDSALEFFGISSTDAFVELGWPVATGRSGGQDRFIGDFIGEDKTSRLVTVRTNFGPRQIRLVIAEHRAGHSTRKCTILILFDICRFVRAVNRHKADAELAIEERRTAEKMLAYRAFQLDGLARYMDRVTNSTANADAAPISGADTTPLPDRYLLSWHTTAKEQGIVSGPLEYDFLPGIGAAPLRFKAAVDAIMAYLITAAGGPGAQIAINTTVSDDIVELKFGGRRPQLADGPENPLLDHFEEAVRITVADCGGELLEIADHELTVVVAVLFHGIAKDTTGKVGVPEAAESAA